MIYKTGRVYRIICLTEPSIQYIGSTFNELRHRWQGHKGNYKLRTNEVSIFSYFDKYGIDNFKMVLIKEYKVVDRHHLRAYEQLCINRVKCINTTNAFMIKSLYQKNYRLNNKDKGSLYRKEYKNNKKDLIKAQQNQKYTCKCGSIIPIKKKSRHEKTKKHINYLSLISC